MASYQYLILGTIGASLILIGIGFLYAKTGTLNIADLAVRVPALGETPAVLAAFAFITVGVLIKLALFPFHHLVAQRLCLRTVAGERLSRCDRDQGRRLHAAALRLHGVRRALRLRRRCRSPRFCSRSR